MNSDGCAHKGQDSTSESSDECGANADTEVVRVAMLSNELHGSKYCLSVRTTIVTLRCLTFATDALSSPTPLVSASPTTAPHTPNINATGTLPTATTPPQTSAERPDIADPRVISALDRPSEDRSSPPDSTLLPDLGPLPPGCLAPHTCEWRAIFRIV